METSELINRLRGIYRIPITDGLGATGGGEEPDNPKEFVRTFETSPIMKEAADVIEQLTAENKRIKDIVDERRKSLSEWIKSIPSPVEHDDPDILIAMARLVEALMIKQNIERKD